VKRVNAIIPAKTSEKLNIRVLRGELLRDISKRYRVSVFALKKANPQLAKGIKHGMLLRIPVKDLSRARITGNPLVKQSPRLLVHDVRTKRKTLGG
jgi:membrane-bound lytic murein transglycosylase D